MSNVIWVGAGVLILLLLLLLLVSRIPNIKAGISGLKRPVVIVLTLVLFAALVFIACRLLLPHGENSLFSKTVEGSEAGEAETAKETIETQEETGGGFSLAEALSGNGAEDQTVYITVAGDTRSIGTTVFADPADLKDALASLKNQTDQFVLVDDYAYAKEYGETKAMLEELGISFGQMQK